MEVTPTARTCKQKKGHQSQGSKNHNYLLLIYDLYLGIKSLFNTKKNNKSKHYSHHRICYVQPVFF